MLSAVPLGAAEEETSPADSSTAAEEPAKKEEGIPWAYNTAMFLALIVTFFQNKFIHGRR